MGWLDTGLAGLLPTTRRFRC